MSAETPGGYQDFSSQNTSNRSETNPFSLQEVVVAGNRGPCGGVNMAFAAADQVLDIVDGREPVYSNWDLVNNKPIMESYGKRGLVTVRNDWTQVPDGAVVFFSAHGVPPVFHTIAAERKFQVIDITCQLVERVHNRIGRALKQGTRVIYAGVYGHPETMGSLGVAEQYLENQGVIVPERTTNPDAIQTNGERTLYPPSPPRQEYLERIKPAASLVENPDDVEQLQLKDGEPAVVYSQTTLSMKELADTFRKIKQMYPWVEIPPKNDICYATDNRQAAVAELVNRVNSLLVVGSRHSHNSQELRRIGEMAGLPSFTVDYPSEVKPEWFQDPAIQRLGVTSGASVQEGYLQDVLALFTQQGIRITEAAPVVSEKDLTFKLPAKEIAALRARYQ